MDADNEASVCNGKAVLVSAALLVVGAAVGNSVSSLLPATERRASEPSLGVPTRLRTEPLIAKKDEFVAAPSGARHGFAAASDWLERVGEAPPSDFPMLLEEIHRKANESVSVHEATNVLFRRWVELDPSSALAYVASSGKPGLSRNYHKLLFTAWAEHDLDEALEAAGSLATKPESQRAIVNVISAISSTNPNRALELYLANPMLQLISEGHHHVHPLHVHSSEDVVESIFSSLSEGGPAGAIEAMERLASVVDRTKAAKGIIRAWVGDDPYAALDWARSLESPSDSQQAMRAALNVWAKNDRAAAADFIVTLPESGFTEGIIRRFLESATDPEEALRFAEKIGSTRSKHYTLATTAEQMVWRGSAVDDILRVIEGIPDVSGYSTLLSALTRRDVDAAVNRVNLITDPERRRKGIGKVVWAAAESDPFKAVELVNSLSPEDIPSSHISYVAKRFANREPEQAIDWAQGLPGEVGRQARSGAMGGWWTKDSQSAEAFALNSNQNRNQEEFFSAIAAEKRNVNPATAVEWVTSLPGEPRTDLLVDVFQDWAKSDVHALSEWAGGAEVGVARDAAIVHIVEAVSADDAPAARIWAESISDDGLRQSVVDRLNGGY